MVCLTFGSYILLEETTSRNVVSSHDNDYNLIFPQDMEIVLFFFFSFQSHTPLAPRL